MTTDAKSPGAAGRPTPRAPRCPDCGRHRAVPIVYGMPAPDLIRAAERGEVALGGCGVTDHDPEWECAVCGCRFREGETE